MKMARIAGVVVLVVVILTAGCATRRMLRRMNQVRLGMTRTEVVEIMGKPFASSARGNVEYLYYRSHKYAVRFEDGTVESYGHMRDLESLGPPAQETDGDAGVIQQEV